MVVEWLYDVVDYIVVGMLCEVDLIFVDMVFVEVGDYCV